MTPTRTRSRKSIAPFHGIRRWLESLECRDVPSVTINVSDATAIEGSGALRFIDRFVPEGSGGLARSRNITFGPDGNQDGKLDLYVASADTNSILRYDGVTGAFIDTFVQSGLGGLTSPADPTFGPDGNLYVVSFTTNQVLRYNGATGAFLDTVVGGLNAAQGITFGSDGSLYIMNRNSNNILRYASGNLNTFVTAGNGGLSEPTEAFFGPDANSDGASDLYVASSGSGRVLRYNGLTGSYIDTFAVTNFVTGPSWIQMGADGFLYASGRYLSTSLNVNYDRFDASTGALVDSYALGRDGWGFVLGPQNVLYVASNAPTGFIDRIGPSSQAAFTVSLDSPSVSPVTVQFTTAPGNALDGSDYVTTSGTITFAPGETTRTILVQTVNDGTVEPTETFVVNLSNPDGATIADGQGVGSITDDDATKFFVVNDGSTDQTYRYGAPGNGLGSSTLAAGNIAPRGTASTIAGDKVWVVDANKTVYVYNPSGSLLGSWTAGGINGQPQIEGIATNGTDVWIVDAKGDKVYRYTGAASKLSGSQNAASSFSLNGSNKNPKGLVTDGMSIWVVDDSTTDKVFKYNLSGTLQGSWTIDAANASPTGLTINPGNVSDIWIIDNGTDKVYQYTAAAGRTSGSQSASATFALAAGNTNPQDIADPPPPMSEIIQPVESHEGPVAQFMRNREIADGLIQAAANPSATSSGEISHRNSGSNPPTFSETTDGFAEKAQAKSIRGTGNYIGWSFAVASTGVVHLTSSFMDAIDFDPDPLATYTLNATQKSFFLLKLQQI